MKSKELEKALIIIIIIIPVFISDSNNYNCDSTAIRLVRESGHHDSMLMKARIHTRVTRRHNAPEVGERDVPTSTIEGCYPMLIRQRECHTVTYTITSLYASTTAFLLDTTPLDATKNEHIHCRIAIVIAAIGATSTRCM